MMIVDDCLVASSCVHRSTPIHSKQIAQVTSETGSVPGDRMKINGVVFTLERRDAQQRRDEALQAGLTRHGNQLPITGSL